MADVDINELEMEKLEFQSEKIKWEVSSSKINQAIVGLHTNKKYTITCDSGSVRVVETDEAKPGVNPGESWDDLNAPNTIVVSPNSNRIIIAFKEGSTTEPKVARGTFSVLET